MPKPSGGTPATVALTRAGIGFTLHEYAHDPRAESYGLEAATALGLDPARVFKTLMANVDGRLAVAIVPVAGRLDLKALARALGAGRATMAERAAAERATGTSWAGSRRSARSGRTPPSWTARPSSSRPSTCPPVAGGWTWRSRRPIWSGSRARSRSGSAAEDGAYRLRLVSPKKTTARALRAPTGNAANGAFPLTWRSPESLVPSLAVLAAS
ncbi:MAG: ybaK 2 [Nocardioides sp.]|nr:ybaK 2 [Nocardioides sp.]